MSRWKWLRERDERLKTASLQELAADIAYCRHRARHATLKSQAKTWEDRRAEAEDAIRTRFGEDALDRILGSSRAWGRK